MILETLIYAVAIVVSVVSAAAIFAGYLKKAAELEADAVIGKATAYANAQKAGYNAEAAAMNYGNEGGQSGQMGITEIIGLLGNPQIQTLLQNMGKKGA